MYLDSGSIPDTSTIFVNQTMYTYNTDILPFILWNLLVILLVGAIYFVTKEIYRIRGGRIGKLGIIAIGTFIGISIALIHNYLGMEVFLEGGTLLNKVDSFVIYNGVLLSPTIIIIIMFVVVTDSRLVFPLLFFQFIALWIKLPIGQPGVEQSVVISYILFQVIEYAIITIILYFVPTINFIKKNGIKVIISIILYLITTLIINAIFQATVSGKPLEVTTADFIALQSILLGYFVAYSVFQLSLVLLVEKLYSNFSALETFSTKDDISYYKMSLAQNRLIKMIDEEKINLGLVVLFQIKANDDESKSRVLEKIRVNTESKYRHTFFFKASAAFYGAFYELSNEFKLDVSLKNNKVSERTEDDELYHITDEIRKISIEEDAQILASGSIYGLQSYSITELIEHARFLMSPIVSRANSNPLIIYDFKRVKERLNETTKVRNLPVDIENMSISYLRGLSSEEIFYPMITFKDDENTLTDVINDASLDQEQKNILLRHTAYQSMRRFDKAKGYLVIYYPLSFFSSEEFKLKDFLKKISRYISEDRLIVGFNTSVGKPGKLFNENISQLRDLGMRVAITNPETITQEDHDTLDPDFIIDPNTDKNPLKIKKIEIKIKTNARLLNSNLVI